MPEARTFEADVFEDGSFAVLFRINAFDDNLPAQQADLTSIDFTVIESLSRSEVVASSALTVANVVFDTLQTDGRWTKDSTGYNFRHEAAPASVPTGGKKYEVIYTFTYSGGQVAKQVVVLNTIRTS